MRSEPVDLGTVLLADPHWVMRASLERTLRHAGASDVWAVADLTSAITALERKPSLIVTELSFGDGSGDNLVRLARNALQPPAIVAMTVRCRAGDTLNIPAEVDAFVFKPFTSEQVLEAIVRAQVSQRRRASTWEAPTGVRRRGYHAAKDDMLIEMVSRELNGNGGSIRATALKLGISRTTVRRLLERSGVRPDRTRAGVDEAG